jgi:hypothetical protein
MRSIMIQKLSLKCTLNGNCFYFFLTSYKGRKAIMSLCALCFGLFTISVLWQMFNQVPFRVYLAFK